MKLIIFDLDQTLVDVLAVHNSATEEVFRAFFNVKAKLTEVDFAGRSLVENFTELARIKGIPDERIKEVLPRLLAEYEMSFVRHFPRNPGRYILPGARRLLQELSRVGHLVVLYTGNSQKIVDKVLAATGLGKYFRFAVYGTEVKARADMVKLALEKAEKLTGRRFRDKEIVIIGDSIRDVECGRQFNALTIAVSTGFNSEEELLKAGADLVFSSLGNYREVLEAIG